MKVKTFRAQTLRAALDQVRAEMGDEAFILATKEIKERGALGLMTKSVYEVAAAIEQTQPAPVAVGKGAAAAVAVERVKALNLRDESPAVPEQAQGAKRKVQGAVEPHRESSAQPDKTTKAGGLPGQPVAQPVQPVKREAQHPNRAPSGSKNESRGWEREALFSPARAPSKTEGPGKEFKHLHRELRELKIALGALMHDHFKSVSAAGVNPDADLSGAHADVFLELKRAGVDDWLAHRLVRAAARYPSVTEQPAIMEIVSAQIRKFVRLAPADEIMAFRPHRAVFVGPTGVGKTTTIAKIAARAALEKRCPVELITVDTYRIAAVEQLRVYAELIGVPLNVAHNVAELDAALRRIGQEKLVLVDTAGCNQNDLSGQMEVAEYLRGEDSLLKHLVVSAATKPDDTRVAAEKFAAYGVNRLVFTKLDETFTHGVVLNEAVHTQLPLSYLTNGQRVPEALLIASPDILTRLAVSSQWSVVSG